MNYGNVPTFGALGKQVPERRSAAVLAILILSATPQNSAKRWENGDPGHYFYGGPHGGHFWKKSS